MQTLLKERFLVVEVDSSKKLMLQTWKGFCNSEELRTAQQKCINLFKENGCKSLVCDTKEASVLKQEDTEWVAGNVTPALAKAGLTALNFVVPASAFAKMTVKNLEESEKKSGLVKVNYYSSLEEAMSNL